MKNIPFQRSKSGEAIDDIARVGTAKNKAMREKIVRVQHRYAHSETPPTPLSTNEMRRKDAVGNLERMNPACINLVFFQSLLDGLFDEAVGVLSIIDESEKLLLFQTLEFIRAP